MTREERLEKLRQLRQQYPHRYMDVVEIGDFTYGKPIVRKWDNKTILNIGKFCSIGDNVQIFLGGEHHTDKVTTYPFDVLVDGQPTKTKGNVIIGNDVWIGNNVTILSGVTIGDGAVIGAGSVVAKDVQHYAVMAGSPARLKRVRECWPGILDVRWWDWPIEKIADGYDLITSDNVTGLIEFGERWDKEHEQTIV